MKYTIEQHHNSNRAARRGLCGWFHNPKTGKSEFKHHVSIQVWRGGSVGEDLPHIPMPVRPNRYFPHVGKKQLAKAATR